MVCFIEPYRFGVAFNRYSAIQNPSHIMVMSSPQPATPQRFLVFGPRGWIGGKMIEMLTEQGKPVKGASCRLEGTCCLT